MKNGVFEIFDQTVPLGGVGDQNPYEKEVLPQL